jgi:hypothetical protein
MFGVVTNLVSFVLYAVWGATTDTAVAVPWGTIIMNALLGLTVAFLVTWVMWFGVIAKHGCCCAIACCCLGKPNILAVAIAAGILAFLNVLAVLDALSHGHILLIVVALVAVVLLVAQVYLTIEAFMVWLKGRSTEPEAKDQKAVVGPPVILGQAVPALEKETPVPNGIENV